MGEEIGYIRPIFGTIKFSRKNLFKGTFFDPAFREMHFATAIHEMIHILGFSKAQYKYFLEND